MVAASLIDAQEHLDSGRYDHAHLVLDAAEDSLTLLCLHLLRLQIRASTSEK